MDIRPSATTASSTTTTVPLSTTTTVPSLGTAITPSGSNVNVDPIPTVDITFSNVSTGGQTTVTTGSNNHGQPSGFMLFGQKYTIETTAVFSGPITVCFTYDQGTPRNEKGVRLFHYDNGHWVDITMSVDTVNNIVCGTTTHFSDFMTGDPETIPNTGRNALPIYILAFMQMGLGLRGLLKRT